MAELPFPAILAVGDDWREVAQQAVEKLRELPPSTLGFVYLTRHLADDATSLLAVLRGATGVPHWVGAVVPGIMAGTAEVHDVPAAAILLLDLPLDSFRVLPSIAANFSAAADALATWRQGHELVFGIVHGDNENPRTPLLVETLGETTGAYLVGGMVAGPTAQISQQLTGGGVSGVLFDDSVSVMTTLSQGCIPAGPRHTITRAEENLLIELDRRPAVEVFKEVVNAWMRQPGMAAAQGDIHASFPIPGSDIGAHVVRAMIGIDYDAGVIAVADTPQQNSHMQFVWRDRASVLSELQRSLEALAARVAREQPGRSPRGAIYVSCVARGRTVFGDEGVELRAIRDALGEVPLIGFFAGGEISNQVLYGYTGVLILFF